MSKPHFITTSTASGVAKGAILTVSTGRGRSKSYRVVGIPTETQLLIDRPWWLPLSRVWSWLTWPVWRLRRTFRDWYLRPSPSNDGRRLS